MSENSSRLMIGAQAPEFTLPAHDGSRVSLSDFRDRKVIVYFYPAAATPGCTQEACDFRDNLASLTSSGYAVLGISKDSVSDLAKFHADHNLTFPLLSDSDLSVHRAYGAYGTKVLYGKTTTGVIRSTIVVDEAGTVTLPLYNVKATGHVGVLRSQLGIAT